MFNESTYPFNFMTTGDGVDSDLVIPDSFGQCLSYEQQIAFILKLIEDIDTGVIVPDITADATVDQSTGTPSVTVVKTGEDEAPVFTFNFHNIKGETGQRGQQGEQGEQGETGRPGNDGADGISPTVTTTQIANGYRITITDADGSHVFDIYNGNDGETGPAGYSPTVTVQTITGGHSVTITDEDGDHSFNVMDGIDGTDGVDGVSPNISVTSITGGHQVSITDAQGTDTFNVMDGIDGTDGTDGSDGVSPVITSTAITGGHRITIVDAQGTTNVDVMDGATGATGNGIASTVLNQDYTLTITYTDGTTYTTPSIRGAQGAAGQNGTDGISPTVTVTDHTNYHHIEITSAGGTEQFDVYDGTDGSDGSDGISPTVTVRSITGGHQIEIVSAGGTEQFDVMDGSDGATGATGPAGPGVASGGTGNQMLVKNSSTDYDTRWVRNPMNPIAELILEDRTTYRPFCKLTFYQYPGNSNGMFVNIKQCGLVLEPDNLNTFNMSVTQGSTSTTVGLTMTGLSYLDFNRTLTAIIKQCAIFNQSIFSDNLVVHYEFRMYFSNTTRSGNEYLSSIPSIVQNYLGGTSITVTDEFQESSLFMLAKANSITVDDWVYYYYTMTLYTGKITTFGYSNGVLTTEVTLSKQNITVGTNDILIPVEGYNIYMTP